MNFFVKFFGTLNLILSFHFFSCVEPFESDLNEMGNPAAAGADLIESDADKPEYGPSSMDKGETNDNYIYRSLFPKFHTCYIAPNLFSSIIRYFFIF